MAVSNSDLRTHVSFMFILKLNAKMHTYDIGVLNDAYEYHDFSLTLKSDVLTTTCIKNLNKEFNNFCIDTRTEICVLNTISKTEPLFLYLHILNQQINANIRFVDLDMIPRRIAAYHITYLGHKKSSEISKYMIERLWQKLIQLEKCPWISASIDNELKQQSALSYRRNKLLRISLYYMIVKHFLVNKARKYKTKNSIATLEK